MATPKRKPTPTRKTKTRKSASKSAHSPDRRNILKGAGAWAGDKAMGGMIGALAVELAKKMVTKIAAQSSVIPITTNITPVTGTLTLTLGDVVLAAESITVNLPVVKPERASRDE
jgi:hypothetical protein